MKKITFLLTLIPLLFACSLTFSQPYTIWNKAYNGPANLQDSAVAVCVNPAGQVFVTGWSIGSTTAADIVTLRYNPDTGDTIWVKRVGSTLLDNPSSMVCDNNAVYVTGWTFNPGRDIITIKFNAATGDTTWVRRYNGTNNGGDYGFSITVDVSGNVYVCGRSDVTGMGQKFTILKYDASGNVAAGFPYIYTAGLSTTFDEAHSIKVDGAGGIYVTGKSGTAGLEDFLTIKLNSAGVLQWAKKYIGASNNEDNAVALVIDATSVFVSGYGFRPANIQDFVVIKYNAATGDSLAFASYTGPANQIDIVTAMTIDATSNVYTTGFSQGTGTGYDYATIKYNSSLVQQWVSRTSDPSNGSDFPYSIGLDATGAVYVTGSSQGTGTNFDYLTVKYNSAGVQQWFKRENGNTNGNDYASSIAVYDTGKIFVTGSANFTPPGSIVYYTIRYSNIVGIKPISNIVPSSYSLNQNYPNPFNPTTNFKFGIPKSGSVNITLYDMLGREMEKLVNENLTAGEYLVDFDASKYSSGVYYYKLTADEFTQTRKMMLIK